MNFVYGFNYAVAECQTMENENLPNFSQFIYVFMYDAVYPGMVTLYIVTVEYFPILFLDIK